MQYEAYMAINFLIYGISSQQEYDYHHYSEDDRDEDEDLNTRCLAVWNRYMWEVSILTALMAVMASVGYQIRSYYPVRGIALMVSGVALSLLALYRGLTVLEQIQLWEEGEQIEAEQPMNEVDQKQAQLIKQCQEYQGPNVDPHKKEEYLDAFFREHPLNEYFNAYAPDKLKAEFELFHRLQQRFGFFKQSYQRDLERQADAMKNALELAQKDLERRLDVKDHLQSHSLRVFNYRTSKGKDPGFTEDDITAIVKYIQTYIQADYDNVLIDLHQWDKSKQEKIDETKDAYLTKLQKTLDELNEALHQQTAYDLEESKYPIYEYKADYNWPKSTITQYPLPYDSQLPMPKETFAKLAEYWPVKGVA
jgi:hypothetical protein